MKFYEIRKIVEVHGVILVRKIFTLLLWKRDLFSDLVSFIFVTQSVWELKTGFTFWPGHFVKFMGLFCDLVGMRKTELCFCFARNFVIIWMTWKLKGWLWLERLLILWPCQNGKTAFYILTGSRQRKFAFRILPRSKNDLSHSAKNLALWCEKVLWSRVKNTPRKTPQLTFTPRTGQNKTPLPTCIFIKVTGSRWIPTNDFFTDRVTK